ncbi:pentapeptide repeat-containing protein [Legionella gresilensis]|uniref:pentapeptide repeat-containing protein n=1 Tax=Legionella gresilensis TaxID=91823 RepID=UPI00104189E1|nr:pentapeptide repeat-containing protein [Legionella gresilensis]
MLNTEQINIFTQTEFYNLRLSNLRLEKSEINNKIFENCKFEKTNFNEAKLINCKFIDCEFLSCDLSAIQIINSSFSDTTFLESKLMGINWTKAKWPLIRLTSPVQFYRSNISYSSFYGLDLKEIIIEECIAHDVDFREGNFSKGNFMLTNFERSLFIHTNLNSTSFIDAINYSINPTENDIRKAKFSIPEVLSLLRGFQIEIE